MRIGLLLIGFLCLNLGISASSPEDGTQNAKRWKRGYVVTVGGDTLEGKIKIPDFLDVYYDFQHKVSFSGREGISQFCPTELNSFSYYDDRDSISQLVTLQSVSSPQGDGRVFLKLYCSGTCRVYGFTITEVEGNNMGSENIVRSSLIHTEKKYIQIRGSEFFPLRMIGFKKNMKDIFAGCPLIISRLNSGIYTYGNWREMVNDYNSGICK